MIENTPSINVDSAQIYTDLNGVQQLKAQSKVDRTAALKNISHQFEAMMMQMMMKSMRDANAVFADGDITGSSDEKFYQDMFDSQLSLSLSKGRGFGIAEAMMRQLQGRFGSGATGDARSAVDKSEHGLDRNATTDTLQSMIAVAAGSDDADSSRLTAAIQDALHSLFTGNESDAKNTAANTRFDGAPSTFLNALRPLAQKIGGQLGVDSNVLLSQSALETGWGQKVLQCADGSSSFNFFNIKADESWTGAVVKVPTIEYQNGVAVRQWANFRAYNSPEESFTDYARLIGENPRYQSALNCAADPRAYMKALAGAGYATDPNYASKVLALYDSEHVRGTVDAAQLR